MAEVLAAARVLVRRMLLHEAGAGAEPAPLAEAAERADARLRARLSSLVGLTGYTILVARALRLAQAEIPALKGVAINALDTGAAGTLHGVREFALAQNDDPGVAEAGLTAMLAHIVGLLATLIGEDLALRLVRDAWPEPTDERAGVERREGGA